MRKTKLIMGMPISVEIVDNGKQHFIENIFKLFTKVDAKFSTFKRTSEITAFNNGLPAAKLSKEMKEVFRLSEETKWQTNGYFDIHYKGKTDPSGMVKGWAIQKAASLLNSHGVKNYCIDAGGDIQMNGNNSKGMPWTVGIRNPFNREQIIKTLVANNVGIATSGTYIRGKHIYDPIENTDAGNEIVSLTIIAPNILDADRFATAAFAMGKKGIQFVEATSGLEGYMVDCRGVATYTSGFNRYVIS